MVQIIDSPKTFGESFSKGLAESLPDAFTRLIERKRQESQTESENKALEAHGINLKGIRDPKVREKLVESSLKDQRRNEFLKKLGITDVTSNETGENYGPLLNDYPHVMDNQQNQQQEQEQQSPRFNDRQILGLSLENPQAANILQKQNEANLSQRIAKEKSERSKFESNREFESKRSLPILKKNDEARESLPVKENSLIQMKDAIRNGDVDSIFNTLADFTGIEAFRSPEGAKFKTAGKEFFLSSLNRVGVKPNQWLEQQVSDALPKIGRSPEGNLISTELLQYDFDIEKRRVELVDELSDKFQKELGYVPGNIAKEADKQLKPYVEQRQKKLAYDLRSIQEEYNPELIENLDKAKPGTPLTETKARYLIQTFGDDAEAVAKKLGYDISDLQEGT